MFGEEIYMVGDNHQVADFKIRICTATGLETNKVLIPSSRITRTGKVTSWNIPIKWKRPLHRHNIFIPSLPKISLPLCPLRRNGEVGNIPILYFILFGNLTCKTAKSGSEDNCCLRMRASFLQIRLRFLEYVLT